MTSGPHVQYATARVLTGSVNPLLRDRMETMRTNIFPKKSQPTLGLPPPGGGGGG